MFVTLELDPASLETVRRHGRLADRADDVLADSLMAACRAGADQVNAAATSADLGFTPQHGGAGLAGATEAWWLDRSGPVAAVGVPANSPAAAYARMLEEGGTIRPRSARALAIPVSPEAKRYKSPREMPGLFMLKRPGKRPLLCESVGTRGRLIVHWVLAASVTIEARHWLSRGVTGARDEMVAAGQGVLDAWVRRWNRN